MAGWRESSGSGGGGLGRALHGELVDQGSSSRSGSPAAWPTTQQRELTGVGGYQGEPSPGAEKLVTLEVVGCASVLQVVKAQP
jgi:hypothetical protein